MQTVNASDSFHLNQIDNTLFGIAFIDDIGY